MRKTWKNIFESSTEFFTQADVWMTGTENRLGINFFSNKLGAEFNAYNLKHFREPVLGESQVPADALNKTVEFLFALFWRTQYSTKKLIN